MTRTFWPSLLLMLLVIPGALSAKDYYRVVNPDGTVAYTDRKPDSLDGVEVIKIRAQQQSLAALRIEGRGVARTAVVASLIHGPLQVELRFKESENVRSTPAMPLRAVLPAESERTLVEFGPANPRASYSAEVSMAAVPGEPGKALDDTIFLNPIEGRGWTISQGWNGEFSHNEDQSKYAVDILVDEGTPVVAAREGVVMQVERHFEGAGLDREKFAGRANQVRILHSDGSMAVYAHLQADSVSVRPGARVRRGQRIALSGNTGFSSGPHLHFVVQLNAGMRLVSVPFKMDGPDGLMVIPGSR